MEEETKTRTLNYQLKVPSTMSVNDAFHMYINEMCNVWINMHQNNYTISKIKKSRKITNSPNIPKKPPSKITNSPNIPKKPSSKRIDSSKIIKKTCGTKRKSKSPIRKQQSNQRKKSLDSKTKKNKKDESSSDESDGIDDLGDEDEKRIKDTFYEKKSNLEKNKRENFFNNTKQQLKNVFEVSDNEKSSDKSGESDSEESDANNFSEDDQNADEFTNHGTPFI